MLHNTGPFGPNDVPVNVNPQSNMTSMSGRMNIGNNINNLAKIPQQSPQMPNPHFNLPDYPTYGLNMNAGLSPFQNFHHVGFQQNSMPQSSIHDSWQNNMLPMNLNMQSEHSMLGFAQYGKPDVSEQSFNKSMLNVPQVHTKAFHKQMGMDVNYHYNLNPSYRPYADYNLDLSSKHKSEDGRQFVDPHSKDRLALSPHYAEQIDLSNKQKMHNFTRPYLDTTKSLISQKHDSIVNINNELAAHLQRSKEKHSYFDNMKSQMGLDNRYESELDLSKSLKSDNLNANYQNVSADLRYYKDQGIRPENDTALPKFSHPDNFNTNFSNLSSDLRIYKNQDPQNLEKNFSKSQLTDNLNTAFQSVNTDLRFYKDKNTLSHSLENTLSKSQKSETAFQNVSSDLRFYKDKDARSQSITDTLSKVQKSENLNTTFQKPENLNTAFQNPNSDLRYYKDKDRPQSLIDALSKTQKSESFNTSFQNVNSDLRFYKDKSQNLEETLSKIHKAENLNTDFLNTVNRFHSETKSKPHNNEEQLHKNEHPESSLITKNTTSGSSDITKYKEHDLRSQSIEKPLPKQQQPENLITNYQNINTDVKFYKDQDSRRRSLENTVKMIENILSHSSNSRKSQSNSYQSKSVSQEECMSQKDKSELNDAENYSEAENDECNEINDSNVTADTSSIDNISDPGNKSDESDMNTSNEMDIDNSNENDDIGNASNDDNENPSNDESESEDNKDEVTVNPLKNPLDDNPLELEEKEVSNTNNMEEEGEDMKETEVVYKSESEESSSEEDVKPKDLEAEIIQQVIKVEDNVVVKVEIVPSMEDIENYNPFHRDIFGVQNDETANHDIIESEASITVAKEVIRNGAAIQGAYFECPHCNLYFNQPKRFLIHTKWHTFGLTNDKRTEVQKEKELRKQLRKEARVVERMNQHEVMDVANTPGKKFNCSDCDKVFLAKASLKNHKQRFHPTRVRNCKICHKTVLGWMALRTHMATHTCESGYQCDKCPKRFKHPHSLAKHRDTHLEKTHGCQQCPKKFGSQTLLNVHMKTHERALRGATFRCTYCGKGFFESYSLQVHERTHRNERPYQCEICNTSFGTNSSLKRHLKVSHSTSKPFECPTCHRSFISEAIRDRHAMRNHGNPEDFKFVCRQCPCKYLKMKDLRKHMYKVHPKGKRKKKSQSESE